MQTRCRSLLSAAFAVSILVTTPSAVLAAPGAGAHTGAPPLAIRSVYDGFEQAFRDKDLHYVERVSTSGFVIRSSTGQTLNHRRAEAFFVQLIRDTKSLKHFKIDYQRWTSAGGRVRVLNGQQVDAVAAGPHGESIPIRDVDTEWDTFVKTRGGWKLSRMDILTERLTMAGKPVDLRQFYASMGAK